MTQTTSTAVASRNPVDAVASRVRQFIDGGELHLPPNYSAENALKSAWLTLQNVQNRDKKPALQVCTPGSIYNALLDMVVQGLNPAKLQGYFIVYGNQLAFQRSYFGDMALVKRIHPQADIWHGVVYEGDEFVYGIERGRHVIQSHRQDISNVNPTKIRAAYCVIEPGGDTAPHTEIMTIDQIKQSWKKSRQYNEKGGDTPHHTQPDQMALRTVIRRACKAVINASSDDYLLLDSVRRSEVTTAEAEMAEEAALHANGEIIDVDVADIEVAAASEEPSDEPAGEPTPAPTEVAAGPGF